jgi:hypothetical protein
MRFWGFTWIILQNPKTYTTGTCFSYKQYPPAPPVPRGLAKDPPPFSEKMGPFLCFTSSFWNQQNANYPVQKELEVQELVKMISIHPYLEVSPLYRK